MTVSPKLSLDMSDLLVARVVDCAARHLDTLLTAYRMKLAKGSSRDAAKARFARWKASIPYAKAFLILESHGDRLVVQKDLAKSVGMTGRQHPRDMVYHLRKWTVDVVKEDGEAAQLRPFKLGRDLWSQRRIVGDSGEIVHGVRMSLYLGSTLTYSQAKDVRKGEEAQFITSSELRDGAAALIMNDSTLTEEQRAEFMRDADDVEAKVRGPQLGLFGKPANEKG